MKEEKVTNTPAPIRPTPGLIGQRSAPIPPDTSRMPRTSRREVMIAFTPTS
jgi:hypothetical protein